MMGLISSEECKDDTFVTTWHMTETDLFIHYVYPVPAIRGYSSIT